MTFIGIGKTPLEVGEKAPNFLLLSSDGKTISLESLNGKKVLLFFFRGTWCPQCSSHMRQINKELSALKSEGIEVLGICCQGFEPLAAFFKREKLFFPLLSDKTRDTAKAYGVYVYLSWDSANIARPSFFLIDENGTIQYRYIGNHQWDRPDMEEIKKMAVKAHLPADKR
jgi:peroxiredoxin Q/BCP